MVGVCFPLRGAGLLVYSSIGQLGNLHISISILLPVSITHELYCDIVYELVSSHV
jgi:hypothetical protein